MSRFSVTDMIRDNLAGGDITREEVETAVKAPAPPSFANGDGGINNNNNNNDVEGGMGGHETPGAGERERE